MSGPPIKIRVNPYSIRLIRGYNSERTNRKRAKQSHLHRHSEELETTIRQLSETTEVLNDRNIVSEQDRVCRTITVACRIDIERIDPNQRCGILCEIRCSAFCEKRMIAAGVFDGAPILVPASVDQHRLV